jgi:hypothetical protein
MKDQNTRLAEMISQANEDSKFDPPPAQPLTQPKIVYEGFYVKEIDTAALISILLGSIGIGMLLWKRK